MLACLPGAKSVDTELSVAVILLTKHLFSWSPTHITTYLALDSGCKSTALLVVLPLVERYIPRGWWLAQDLTLIQVRELSLLSSSQRQHNRAQMGLLATAMLFGLNFAFLHPATLYLTCSKYRPLIIVSMSCLTMAAVLGPIAGLPVPVVRAYVSKHVPDTEQVQLSILRITCQSACASVVSVTCGGLACLWAQP
jgi:hypothetical protein